MADRALLAGYPRYHKGLFEFCIGNDTPLKCIYAPWVLFQAPAGHILSMAINSLREVFTTTQPVYTQGPDGAIFAYMPNTQNITRISHLMFTSIRSCFEYNEFTHIAKGCYTDNGVTRSMIHSRCSNIAWYREYHHAFSFSRDIHFHSISGLFRHVFSHVLTLLYFLQFI